MMSLTETETLTNNNMKDHNGEVDFLPFDNIFGENNEKLNACKDKECLSSCAKLLKQSNGSSAKKDEACTKESLAEEKYLKLRRLLNWEDAPAYQQHNPYIRTGYRQFLPTKLCWESVFWWTNETINIWSHLFGWFLFLGLTINDLVLLNIHATFNDKLVVAVLLGCFQACMVLSSLYHTFSCRSEQDSEYFLMYDLFGIALSLLAIYTSGIYYAFWCHQELKTFYLVTVTVIFWIAMLIQLPRYNVSPSLKMLVFVAWAAYGVVPTIHWCIVMGGFDNPMVALLFPRVIGMYAISGIAFAIYTLKIPERWCAGKFDYLGHSHQWWHLFVVLALYYWHNSGMMYVEYRMNHGCARTMRIF